MKNWETFKTTYKVSDFVSWQRSKTLELSPSFQRRPVWQPGAKSYLIDTIIRGLPIPIIFLREQKTDLKSLEPRREVVDGQQRIRTVLSFIEPNLLKDYEPARDDFVIQASHNEELSGKKYSDLDDEIQQSILDYIFSVHILPSQVDDRARPAAAESRPRGVYGGACRGATVSWSRPVAVWPRSFVRDTVTM